LWFGFSAGGNQPPGGIIAYLLFFIAGLGFGLAAPSEVAVASASLPLAFASGRYSSTGWMPQF